MRIDTHTTLPVTKNKHSVRHGTLYFIYTVFNSPMSKLLQDLVCDRKLREKEAHEMFKHVLCECEKEILLANTYDAYELTYSPPMVTKDNTLYDRYRCCRYVARKLQKQGLKARVQNDTKVHISWEHALKDASVDVRKVRFDT